MLETLHLLATVFMVGVIAFVQVVHYPLMARVGAGHFASYESGHTARTGWIVIPPMVIEAVTSLWLAVESVGTPSAAPALVGAGLVGVIWVSTALLQAPAHGRLIRGFDEVTHRRLVLGNWIRTVAWIFRVPIAVLLLP